MYVNISFTVPERGIQEALRFLFPEFINLIDSFDYSSIAKLIKTSDNLQKLNRLVDENMTPPRVICQGPYVDLIERRSEGWALLDFIVIELVGLVFDEVTEHFLYLSFNVQVADLVNTISHVKSSLRLNIKDRTWTIHKDLRGEFTIRDNNIPLGFADFDYTPRFFFNQPSDIKKKGNYFLAMALTFKPKFASRYIETDVIKTSRHYCVTHGLLTHEDIEDLYDEFNFITKGEYHELAF